VPNHIPALASRAAIVATTTAAAALIGVLPAATASAAPGLPAPAAPVAPAAAAPVAPAVVPVALVRPAPAAAARTSAVGNAMSKIGAPYRWGASGPDAFDCSGLVSWAFKKTGVSLPRTSSAMSKVGTPVSKADLQPGDLVFFYKPVRHVGIYVGGGKIVHAPNKNSPVKVSEMGGMTFNSARRL
jgi:peptidoglycan DL-endopeptidase CwlO